jgi:hypothetical protein
LSGLRQVGRLEVRQEAEKVVLIVRAHILFSPTSFRHDFDFAAVVAAHPGDSFVLRDETHYDRPIAADWSCGASKVGP